MPHRRNQKERDRDDLPTRFIQPASCAVDSALADYQRQIDKDDDKENFTESFINEQLVAIKDSIKGNEYLSSFIDNNEDLLAEHLEGVAKELLHKHDLYKQGQN